MKYTYYDVLQVTEFASPEIIRAAYLALAKKYHPDVCSDDPKTAEKMKIINTAYAVLSDPDKRNRYDLMLRSQRSGQTSPSAADVRSQYNAAGQTHTAASARESSQPQKKEPSWYVPLLVLFLMFALPIMLWMFLDFTVPDESYTKPEINAHTEAEPYRPKTINYNSAADKQVSEPVPEPATGKVISGYESFNASEITVTASRTSSCLVKLKDSKRNDKLSFYVRAGETVTVGVPDTDLYVYFASGETWYGEDLLFGEKTYYSKDDRLLNFCDYTWSYTLYPVTDGNFSETPIDAEEFN